MWESEFSTLNKSKVTARVKNPESTTMGALAARAARDVFKLAGGFETLNSKNEVISPNTLLVDLPQEETYTLAPELSPACPGPTR